MHKLLLAVGLFFLFTFHTAFAQTTKVPKEFKKMKTLSSTSKSIDIKVGETFLYPQRIHSSVGKGGKFNIPENNVVKNTDTKVVFDQVQPEGMTGGDAATQYFVFKGLKKGTTAIVFEEWLRGERTNTQQVTINVR